MLKKSITHSGTCALMAASFSVEAHNNVVVVPLRGGKEMTVITASINANVTVARSNDSGLRVNRTAVNQAGNYVVVTSTNTSNCIYVATPGSSAKQVGPREGQITVGPSGSSNKDIYIQTSGARVGKNQVFALYNNVSLLLT